MNENESFFEDLRRDVDDAHGIIDGANAPPRTMWTSIRAQAQPETKKEETTMIASKALSHDPAAIARPVARQKGGVRHTLGIAASFALVMSVAFAGWFATMQLNQPGDSNGQFALFGQTDEAVCDVEPLSVDRVIDIVKNPVPFVMNGPGGEPTPATSANAPWSGELYEADLELDLQGSRIAPSEEQFDAAGSVADAYIQCMVTGTLAQVFSFWHPVVIQESVLLAFPVFADEASVREMLEIELPKQALELDSFGFWADVISAYDVASIGINPERELALYQESLSSYAEGIVTVGAKIENPGGDTVLLVTATGNQLVSRDAFKWDMLIVTVAKSRSGDNWYVISHFPYP